MSVKPIREYHGKRMLYKNMGLDEEYKGAIIIPDGVDWLTSAGEPWTKLAQANPWLLTDKLVVKPDQLIKRRGKAGLIKVNCDWETCKSWILERCQKETQVEKVSGQLTHFLVEPFLKHSDKDEYYICFQAHRYFDEVYFYHEGGVDIGDVDAKAKRMQVPTGTYPEVNEISQLISEVPDSRRPRLAAYIEKLFRLYSDLHYSYMEINPLVFTDDGKITPLDLAAKIDETASFIAEKRWGEVDFPQPFGNKEYPEEAFIRKLDEKTGASLKLTVINPKGRVWTMVAGGGASVIYADTVVDYGHGNELANYGEYSGAPSAEETFQYASTLFKLMLQSKPRPDGKVFLVGGGIANFTDVSATFGGLIKAINEYQEELREHKVSFWVRRAGLNFMEGLKKIKDAVSVLNIDIHVYGPETHMTAIVPMALGLMDVLEEPNLESAEYFRIGKGNKQNSDQKEKTSEAKKKRLNVGSADPVTFATADDMPERNLGEKHPHVTHDNLGAAMQTMDSESTCIVYNLQQSAVQRMLDFDGICGRKTPSVSAVVFPFGGRQNMKVYWGVEEIFVPVYPTIKDAIQGHPLVSIMVNFASFRSSFESTMDAMKFPNLRTIAVIAEGMPERQSRELIKVADQKGVSIIGPATVGGIKPGGFRIGNTGGAIENIIMSKLYRPGSVAYVSRSGGMSNELNNIICRNANGVNEGIAVGGDRYPGTRFLDHLLRYQKNPEVKMLVLLGEVGGVDEYEVVDAVKDGRITKPLVAWCVGTCAACFGEEMQFGHAGAQSRGTRETAATKNKTFRETQGIFSPDSFDALGSVIGDVYNDLLQKGVIQPIVEPEEPVVPKDFKTLQAMGVVRPTPANIVCSISDDRGDEVTYSGMKLSHICEEELGIGGVISLLWFRRKLPSECCKFLELVLTICADHGPAVSGAHNAIVCARAGKDVVDSLCSGLLTIGPRFGGALDGAAKTFSEAFDSGISPLDFVNKMKATNQLILGIGHRIKSKLNPDKRVEIMKDFCLKNWSSLGHEKSVLGFALAVEELTVKKKANLILNVDGVIAVGFVDMARRCKAFTREEADQMVKIGVLNGLFVASRSIGLIGHILDQKRLNQGLYRHPWQDIAYIEEKPQVPQSPSHLRSSMSFVEVE